MQDFTKPFSIDTKPKQVKAEAIEPKVDMAAPNLTKQPQKTFWDSRMNKSNFWNLMFGIGMVLGGFITLKFGKAYPTLGFICAWTTLIGVPLAVRYFSKVTFTDGKFLTIEGRELDIPKQLPNGFLLIVTTIGTVILIGAISDKFPKPHLPVVNFIFLSIFLISLFFIPVLFFILKNCPISILFNYQFLKQQNARASNSSCYSGSEYKSSFTDDDYRRSSPTQSYRPGNIYHSSRY
ncbi:hypothetical protein MPCS_01635 (plasmid) [Candidatus Megaera polyxenophila]|nr:hypothetical protein MPCS_01635 [Candidatus Megaera polyxenophila]